MASLKNAIEDIVLKEAQQQLGQLRNEVKPAASLSEVVAYALNRLPTMYVTTQNGWIQQRARATQELDHRVADAVSRGIKAIQLGDPLHDSTPIPEIELSSKSRALIRLRHILVRPTIRWRDVPSAVEHALSSAYQDPITAPSSVESLGNSLHTRVKDLKSYLARSKRRYAAIPDRQYDTTKESPWVKHVQETDQMLLESKELESYTLTARLGYSNVLENLVMSAAQNLMQHLSPAVKERINLDEIAAYALNRLPPMYATCDRGFRHLRQRAIAELAKEIVTKVRQAIMKVGRSPQTLIPPHPLEKFNREHDLALAELRTILQSENVTTQNVVNLVEKALQQKKAAQAAREKALQLKVQNSKYLMA